MDQFDIKIKTHDAESIDEAKTFQKIKSEVRERRNGYQKISTDAYYRIERRKGSGQSSQDVQTEVDGSSDFSESPFGGSDVER